MPSALGVYVCGGCAIGEALDLGRLVKVATKDGKAAVTETHPFLCGADGLGLIRRHLDARTVDGIVIAACSPRVKTEAFSFDRRLVVERVNLREHVTWCQKPKHEDTQMMAEDYLRMGIAKARKMEPLEPVADPISRTILVVGGGTTGITAALEAAESGYAVVLVEKEARLGGFAAGLTTRFPRRPPYADLETDGLKARIEAVTYHPKVTVLTSARVARTEGQPGMFTVRVERGDDAFSFTVGAVVMATGWKPYDATKLANLGYGLSPDVITNVEFESLVVRDRLARPSDGRPIESVLFVQCAGSRDAAHLPYCSSVCCLVTLKQGIEVHRRYPEARVYVVYKDMRTPGPHERFYREAQDHPLSFFTKGEVTGIATAPNGQLSVTLKDTLLGAAVRLQVDLVVLATGMVPNGADGEAIRAFEDAKLASIKAETETQRAEAAKRADALKAHEGTAILNLAYRQGPDLPVLRYGFPDSHFICFPYETRRTGIYAAGALRAPMDTSHAEEDALGATLKAIQSIEAAASGAAVHPRSGDLSFPAFFLQRCTQCKRCTEECPFGTLDEDEKGTPTQNPYRCRRCGICMGSCPERIISFQNYSVDMIASMIKAIEVPEEDEEKPRVLVFMCENDAYPALDVAGLNRLGHDPSVRVVPLRCLGSLNIVWIADALSRGIDGVMLIGCKLGDDYQCHFVKGSELASRRLDNVKETLDRLRLERERIELTELAINDYQRLPHLIDAFVARIRKIGPNPFKGL